MSPFAPTCSGLIPGYDSTLAGFRGSAATGHGDLRISHIPAHPPMGTSAFTAQCKHAARSAKTGAAVRAALGFVACECRRPLRPCPVDLPRCFHFGNIVGVTDSTDFAQRLGALLEERGMTQLELAARVGVTRAAMSRYVSGDREPRFVTLVRIVEELDVRVEDLLPTSGDPVQTALRIVARTSLTDEQMAQFRRILDEGDLE